MIIRKEQSLGSKSSRLRVIALVVGVVSLILLFVLFRKPATPVDEVLLVDMETTVEKDGQRFFSGTQGSTFAGGSAQSKEKALSGGHSAKVFKDHEFALTYETNETWGGEVYEVTVWRHSTEGFGNLVVDGAWGYYEMAKPTGKKDLKGWEELQIRFKIPDHVTNGKLKIYVWNPKPEPAYFDDLSIRVKGKNKLGAAEPQKLTERPSSVNLVIEPKDMEKLKRIRREAMEKGILAANVDAWVKVRVEEGKGEWRGMVRLKGDWTDHLQGDKWSYRVALDKGQSWRSMRTFSFQSPHTRSFLDEWTFHQWLEKEDLLSPRYDFVELKVNGISKGLYAFEEHFEQQLVESKQRREGPIMKFNEEGFWEIVEQSLEDLAWIEKGTHYVEASTIDGFKLNATLKDKNKRKEFELATVLMEDYKNGRKQVGEIFDLNRLAKYYAIVDLAQAFHGLVWHNQRFYYNPIISKMEPIGFDGYTADGPLLWLDRPFLGHGRNMKFVNHPYREQMFSRLFADEGFVAQYVSWLWKLSDPDYLQSFFEEITPALAVREAWIQQEWPTYRYRRSLIFDESQVIRQIVHPLKLSSVKVHAQGKIGQFFVYRAMNYHCLPVKLLGVGKNAKTMEHAFKKQASIGAYVDEYPAPYAEVRSDKEGSFVFFEVPGIDSVFSVEILPWSVPEGQTPEQELFANVRLTSNSIYQVDSLHKEILFGPGPHRSSVDILIPDGWMVRFAAGAELDLVTEAKFISKSPVVINGTEDKPVRIFSSDRSGNGFTLLQPEGKCVWTHAVFDGLGALDYGGWEMTGAVTVYEGEVSIQNCRFVNNFREDGLSLIRTIFDIRRSLVHNSFEDGLDIDFSKGMLQDLRITKSGKDALELSGSSVNLRALEIEGAKEKGINLNDASKVEILSAKVAGCNVGLASVDRSKADVKQISLVDNTTSFSAFQKKPEFGPAQIWVEKYTAEGNQNLYLLQNGSELKIDGKVIKGKL